MSTSNSTSENSIGSIKKEHISGPHWEPPTIPNATTYWRCTSCQRESTCEQDLHRERFHAPSCEVHQ
ncbi:hypothetical protein [Halalkalicoccus salilacus]|uniref:hypothetical protein n=1 Tax=Halalkalicoccus salilacus TaxID=3117459 RepID=UPI00300EC8FA